MVASSSPSSRCCCGLLALLRSDQMDAIEGSEEDHVDTRVDWDSMFRLFSESIAHGGEASQVRAAVEVGWVCKRAPERVVAQAIPLLVDLLGSPSSAVQEAVARSLCCIARCGDGFLCPAVGRSGAVPALLRLLPLSTDGLQKRVVKCLRVLAASFNSNRLILARNGVVEAILDLLPLCPEETRQNLLEVLTAVAMLREVRRAIVNLGALPFLVEAASCGKMVSRGRAAYELGLLGSVMSVRHVLVELGVIPVLINLLRGGDPQAKLVAGNSLGVIISHVDYLRPVVEAGAIPLYAELLEGPEALGKEIAEDVLCILAVTQDNAILILQHLVRILQGNNDEAKAAAADIVWSLTRYDFSISNERYEHPISIVRESGAFPLLLNLVQEGGESARENALGAIVQLSYEEAERKALAEAGAIPVLIGLLSSETRDLKDNAIEALINFSQDPSFYERVSVVFDDPLFQAVQDRLVRIHASDEHMVRSLRQLTVGHLSFDPDFI